MNKLPDSVLLKIFSCVHWQDQIRLEAVSTRWNDVLNDKSLRKIGKVYLNLLVKGDISKLPRAVHSLLVNKNKIINSITYDTEDDNYVLNTIMSTFSSNRPEQLIGLKFHTRFELQSEIDNFSRFLDCFVNLEVLDLNCFDYSFRFPQIKIDLSQFMKLKELKGDHVHFVNYRAPNLVKMEIHEVSLNSQNDCDALVQLMSSMADSIEILNLNNVSMDRCSAFTTDIKFPRLSDFKLCGCTLDGITVNLAESRCLKRIDLSYGSYDITHFNLSIHCLEYFYINLFSNSDLYVNQFLASAKADPQRLCLLEYLQLRCRSVMRTDLLTDLVECFHPSYTYSLREFISDQQLTDCSGLIALIKHSPLLNRICFKTINDEQVLIDLIVGTISLDVHVNGLRIERQHYFLADRDFLSTLYNALCLIDPTIMKCKNKVFVKTKVSNDAGDFIRKMKDEFNILFFSTDEQFKLEFKTDQVL